MQIQISQTSTVFNSLSIAKSFFILRKSRSIKKKEKWINKGFKNRWRDSTGGQCLGDCGSLEFFSGPLGGEAITRVPLCPELDKQGRKWVNLRLIARRKRNQKTCQRNSTNSSKARTECTLLQNWPTLLESPFWCCMTKACVLFVDYVLPVFFLLSWILFRHSNYSFAGPAPILSESKGNEGKNEADRSVGRTKRLFPKVSANGVTKKARTDPAQVVSLFLLLKSLIANFILFYLFTFSQHDKRWKSLKYSQEAITGMNGIPE